MAELTVRPPTSSSSSSSSRWWWRRRWGTIQRDPLGTMYVRCLVQTPLTTRASSCDYRPMPPMRPMPTMRPMAQPRQARQTRVTGKVAPTRSHASTCAAFPSGRDAPPVHTKDMYSWPGHRPRCPPWEARAVLWRKRYVSRLSQRFLISFLSPQFDVISLFQISVSFYFRFIACSYHYFMCFGFEPAV